MDPNQDSNDSLPLPVDKMPECWDNVERMNSLFAQFRNRAANQQDWDSKYVFWRNMIFEWAAYKMRNSFTLTDLNKAFKRNGRTPLCLPIVVQELYRNGEIVLQSDFVHERPNSWVGWAVNTLIQRPVVWSFAMLKKRMVEPSVDPETKYVHVRALQELAKVILSTLDKSKENKLLTLAEIKRNVENKTGRDVTNENIKLALTQLRHNKNAAYQLSPVQNESELLVKLSTSTVKDVTEVEIALHKLEKQEEMLIKNLEILEQERDVVMKNAKSYIANGMRQVAKSCLRKKNEIDKSIEKRAAALQNVQVLISRVQDADSDANVLTSYKTGAAALKKKLGEDGLTDNDVADTMNDLAEVLEEFSEVESVMSKSINLSDQELEDELSELLAETCTMDDSVSSATTTSVMLPDVPVTPSNLKSPGSQIELPSVPYQDLRLPLKHSPVIKSSPAPSQGE